jgi:ATP/maltotriose-dependent transcriptional regulator MalT
MLPVADSLDSLQQAELLWSAAIVITDVGDDTAAPPARQRLTLASAAIEDTDPYLHALSELAIAGLSAIEGDVDRALDAARTSTDQLLTTDEPFWTALGMLQVGFLEIIVGRLDDALDHLLEVRRRAAQFDTTWLSAWTGAALGNLAILQARPDDAADLLDEALRWSVTAHTPRTITLCVAAYSRLALALGEPELAALLAGAADGLRRRAGLRPWPSLRQGEMELLGTIRRALDPNRFDEAFATGAGLRIKEAVYEIQRWRGIAIDA